LTAQTTVTIAAVYVDGTPLANHRVKVRLIHGGAGGTVDGNLIAEDVTVKLDADGGSVDLYPTDAISPPGCFYRFTVDNSSPTIVRDISVPASGPVAWTDAAILLEDPVPPVTIPAAVSGTAGQVLGVVDPGDGPRYDLIDQTGGGTTDASELTTGTLPFARLPIGTTSTTVPAGNDTRLSDARTPTAHKTSHATGGGDALAPSDIGAVPMSRTLAGLDLSADWTASALRTALGLVIGTDVLAPNGSGASLTGIPESAVTNLVTDLAAKAPLASPALTGSPTAPTQSAGDNSTKVATTAYADTAAAFAKPHMTYAGAYQASTVAMVASTITSFAAVNYEGYVPMFLVAGTYDRVGLYTTVAAVSTWEMGLYSVGASGQPTSQITSFGSLNMNATAGLNLITLAPLTVYATAWYYVGIKITAFTASPTLHRMPNTSVPAFPGWPIREIAGEAWSWLTVTTGAASGALPSTAPAIGTGSGQAAYANLAPRVLFRKA